MAADEADDDAQLADGTWQLVLASLTAEEQRTLAATYEELADGAGATIEHGDGGTQSLMRAIAPAEPLLAGLPHATFKPSGTDDYDLRRRTLTVEVEWAPTSREAAGPPLPVLVSWLDGYQTTVATMSAALIGGSLSWRLNIHDPAPGRDAERTVPNAKGDADDAARNDFHLALEWAASQLDDDYVVQTP